jgi:hypothetical protein
MKEELTWHPIATPPDDDREVMVIDEDGLCFFANFDHETELYHGGGWYDEHGTQIRWGIVKFWAELPKGPAGSYAVKITADGFEVRNRPVGKPFCVEQDAKKAIQLAQQLNSRPDLATAKLELWHDFSKEISGLTAAQNSTLAPTCPPAGSGVPQQGVKLGRGTFKP